MVEKENSRWEKEDDKKAADLARVAKLRAQGTKAKRNVGRYPPYHTIPYHTIHLPNWVT
jgi:hypothetical protein